METVMKMPDLATTGSPIKVLRWLVAVGQTVERGQPLLEVETDKAVMEVESLVSGHLHSVSASEGQEVEAGNPIAIFATDRPEAALAARHAEKNPVTTDTAMARSDVRDRHLAAAGQRESFFARNRRARAARGQQPAAAAPTQRPRIIDLSVPQRVVAGRMKQSKQTIPHFYLQTSAHAETMVARRNTQGDEPTVLDAFFVHAAGKALRRFERLTFRFEDDRLVSQGVDAVGVAVDLGGDLFTLAIENPADKSPEVISREIKEGVMRLLSGDPRARMARTACMTVSNLGGSGIESFAAVINPPESAILAVGRIIPTVTVTEGQIVVQQRVNLTLSVDHRVASGKYAAEFLKDVVRELECL